MFQQNYDRWCAIMFLAILLLHANVAAHQSGGGSCSNDLEDPTGCDGYEIQEPVFKLNHQNFSTFPEEWAIAAALGPQLLECPSSNVIVTTYKCQANGTTSSGQWVDCIRKSCCQGYVYIAGRCVAENEDPCALGLCEQRCTVFLQRVICTCNAGFRFNISNQRAGLRPLCVDVNECEEGMADCEQVCENEAGSYHCGCREGFVLQSDNRTCAVAASAGVRPPPTKEDTTSCKADCVTVARHQRRLRSIEETVRAVSTAIKLSSLSNKHNMGPAGPPGPEGPRGFPGPAGPPGEPAMEAELDSYVIFNAADGTTGSNSEEQRFCRCKRGPMGPIGAPGKDGPKGEEGNTGPPGEKGECASGSLDYLLLLLADLRHDITKLQERVFHGEKPPRFDLRVALKQQLYRERKRLERQQRLLQGHTPPHVSATAGLDLLLRSLQLEEEQTTNAEPQEYDAS